MNQTGGGPDGPRWRRVRVDKDRLAGDRLSLNLFTDVTLEARRTSAEAPASGAEAWKGIVDGEPLSAVTFVRAGDIVQGSVRSAAGVFAIEPLGNGPDHIVRQIDSTTAGPELVPLAPPPLPSLPAPLDHATPTGQDDGRTVDLLAVYTASARQRAGGSDAAVRARIALGVAETNTAYANSGVTQRIRLVGAELIGYHESGDLSSDLERLTRPADGEMDLVHPRRDAVGADLVTLIVGASAEGACGVAWLMENVSTAFAPYAFSVTAYPCISPNYTFGHELGHNMGSAHAPDDPNTPPAFPYSYGYKDPAQAFRTLMAYDCAGGCPRILNFSNPAVSYTSRPTGTAARHNNALSINQTAATVANFRLSRVPGTLLSAPPTASIETFGIAARVSWTPPATGMPTQYLIEVGSEEGFDDIARQLVSGASTSFVQSAVPPGTYFIRVRAVDATGPSAPSPSVQLVMTAEGRCLTPASAPALRPAVVTGTTAALSWSAPASGAPISRYVVGVGTYPQSMNVGAINTAGPVTSLTAPAAPGVYFIRVAAVNGCGVGAPSNEIAIVVGAPVPGPPTGLVASISVGRVVNLSWRAPTAGGAPTQYVIEAGSAPGKADLAVLPTGSAQPGFVIVAPPGRYYVRVRAVNAKGSSVPSEEIAMQVI